jgi:hypothetical protein
MLFPLPGLIDLERRKKRRVGEQINHNGIFITRTEDTERLYNYFSFQAFHAIWPYRQLLAHSNHGLRCPRIGNMKVSNNS